MVAYNIIAYGLGYYEDKKDRLYMNNVNLLKGVWDAQKKRRSEMTEEEAEKNKIVFGCGSGDLDSFCFIGIYIAHYEDDIVSLEEFNRVCQEKDYAAVFQQRLALYPGLEKALEPYKNEIGFKVMLNR